MKNGVKKIQTAGYNGVRTVNRVKFLSKLLFVELTWFYVVYPNLDPTLLYSMAWLDAPHTQRMRVENLNNKEHPR